MMTIVMMVVFAAMAGSGPAYIYQVQFGVCCLIIVMMQDDIYDGDNDDGDDDLYIYNQVIEALADGAVMMGLPRALATEQVAKTNDQTDFAPQHMAKTNK